MTEVLNYGGGVQTVAMCLLVHRGILPKPDRVVFADTGREMPSTAAYMEAHVQPLLTGMGIEIEIAPHNLATVDLYSHGGDLLVPAFTATGKLQTWCSNEWKAFVVQRFLRSTGVSAATNWIGFSLDERRRVKGGRERAPWRRRYPLIDLMLTRADCLRLIEAQGWPAPAKSRCWMCPHQSNAEWREVRRDPALWAKVIALDEEIREADERGGVYLHASRRPLAAADIDTDDRKVREGAACGFGGCWI